MREILSASPAAEAGSAFQPAAVVSIDSATMRANWLAFGFGPTDTAEGHFRLGILHRENLRQREAFSGGGERKCWAIVTYRLCELSYSIGIDSQVQNIICDSLSYAIGHGSMNIKSEEEWAERAARS